MKSIKIFLQKIKVESDNMVANLGISQKKSKNYLSIQKNITKCKKINIYCNKG